ncbi:peroxidase 2 [Brachypodium distachyon]|uniref:Peroxidase n=1 Tax=Brachypodium distachyon TaxID=15368 RepID=I1ITK9_BRADI|nr:peroxidase 2 [Brachypodium distachyon]PNT65315.1 hypothetical protein BRADI_4g40190v3 [Brachypodium distachyon]|eukprot:XP_003578784.1 peroxidase 2 [Brachypodium distachyon]
MASSFVKLSVALTCLLLLSSTCHGSHGPNVGHYKKTCPNAEAIVRDSVKSSVYKDAGVGAGLIRLLFHDCFVQGCDGSVLLDPSPSNPQPEKLSAPNFRSLRGFEAVDAAKAAVERACPGVVSCADVVAFAARDAAYFLSGLRVKADMPGGRLDGRVSRSDEAARDLPPASANLAQLVSNFAAKGLGEEDMVVLSGAHSVGASHCSSFVPGGRLEGPGRSDMDAGLAAVLKKQCAPGQNPLVPQDAVSPNALDSQYYRNVLAHKVLLPSDAALLAAPATEKMVRDNAYVPGKWEGKFAEALVKMAAIGVKTGQQGEIRKNCRVVN